MSSSNLDNHYQRQSICSNRALRELMFETAVSSNERGRRYVCDAKTPRFQMPDFDSNDPPLSVSPGDLNERIEKAWRDLNALATSRPTLKRKRLTEPNCDSDSEPLDVDMDNQPCRYRTHLTNRINSGDVKEFRIGQDVIPHQAYKWIYSHFDTYFITDERHVVLLKTNWSGS